MDRKIGNSMQLCSVERVIVNGGRGDGLKLIVCSNGKLNFTLCESRCLDLFRLYHEGMNVGFVSKNGLYAPQDEFSRTFPAGMLYTCGLDSIGAREGYPLHGRIHNIPADVTECRADEKGIRIVAEIRDSELFGKNLLLKRTVQTAYGSGELSIVDELVNERFTEEKYCLLYHVNIGFPIVDEGATIEGELEEYLPRTPWAKENENSRSFVEAPVDNAEETCYFYRLKTPCISLVNANVGKRFSLRYSDDTLPYLVEWKSRASGDFVIGLEPCTSWLDEHFAYRTIKSGEKLTHRISIKIENL